MGLWSTKRHASECFCFVCDFSQIPDESNLRMEGREEEKKGEKDGGKKEGGFCPPSGV